MKHKTPSPKNMQSAHKEHGVITLFAIFGVGIFALGTALSITLGSLAVFANNRNATSGDQVFYTSESGVSEGAYQYLANPAYTGGAPQLLNNTTGGHISVSPLPWPYVLVKSSTQNSATHRGVAHTVTVFPEGLAFDYAVYANDDLNFGGNAEVNGNVFSNTDIGFNGNSAEINGNAYAVDDVEDPDNVDGMSLEGVSAVPQPSLDLTPYRTAADVGGTRFTTVHDAETYLNNKTQTAIVVVEDTGNLKLHSSTNLTGSLVAIGDLDLTGGTYTGTAPYAAIVVLGDLKVSGDTTINGIVFVSGSTTFGAGNATINGSLIAVGGASTDIIGSTVINFDPTVAATWPTLAGLNTTSVSPPKIILWEEE